jgi:carboxymethylenebutenolidase
MTGGIGRKLLTGFYRDHFIFSNPPEIENELVSRTIGIDRVCDEFIMNFTHTREVDWLAPGVPHTDRSLRIPFTSIVNIRGDRLYHEHIAWDQAIVLIQLGLLPEYLPYPYRLPDGWQPGPGKRFEVRVPAAGVETVAKMLDKNGVEFNEMLEYKVWEVSI